jgi:hypothetical protein
VQQQAKNKKNRMNKKEEEMPLADDHRRCDAPLSTITDVRCDHAPLSINVVAKR